MLGTELTFSTRAAKAINHRSIALPPPKKKRLNRSQHLEGHTTWHVYTARIRDGGAVHVTFDTLYRSVHLSVNDTVKAPRAEAYKVLILKSGPVPEAIISNNQHSGRQEFNSVPVFWGSFFF